jgi:hypothetical protein
MKKNSSINSSRESVSNKKIIVLTDEELLDRIDRENAALIKLINDFELTDEKEIQVDKAGRGSKKK